MSVSSRIRKDLLSPLSLLIFIFLFLFQGFNFAVALLRRCITSSSSIFRVLAVPQSFQMGDSRHRLLCLHKSQHLKLQTGQVGPGKVSRQPAYGLCVHQANTSSQAAIYACLST
jgi:hypothetical protein